MPRTVKYKQSSGGLGIESNGTTAATYYTFSASLVSPDGTSGPGGVMDASRVYNADTVQHGVELHLVPNGDAADHDTLFWAGKLAPGEVVRVLGPERAPSQATLQVKLTEAHTTRGVRVKADVTEVS